MLAEKLTEDDMAEEEKKKKVKMPTSDIVLLIYAFCEALSGIHFFPYQAELAKRIIRSLLENDGEEITSLWSRQSGKSHTVSAVTIGCAIILPVLAHTPMFIDDIRFERFRGQKGLLVGIFAPALHQAQIIFNKIKDFLDTESAQNILVDPDINVCFDTNNGENIVMRFGNFPATSTITCMSASDKSNIEGKTFMLTIVDESQDVSDFKYSKSIFPMSAFFNGTRMLIGTATIKRGFFYDSIEQNKKDYVAGDRKKCHFENDWRVVVKYNPNYEKHVKEAMRKMGPDSDEFNMSYNLRWIFERGMFIEIKAFEALGDTNLILSEGDKSKKHVAGIDLGKAQDSTVVTILEPDWDNPVIIEESKSPDQEDYVVYNTKLKAWMEIEGDNWDKQYYAILEFLDKWELERVAIDSTGVGSPMYDRLAPVLTQRGVGEVIPYTFSQQAKSALMKHFDSEMKSGRFQYPASTEVRETREYQRFMEQFINAEKSYSGSYMIVSHPNKRGAHDDYVFSAALATWAAKGAAAMRVVSEGREVLMHSVDKKRSVYYSKRNRLTARRGR